MAFHSRKEYAELAGLKDVKSLNAYVSRGKIIVSGKFIDSENLENKEWLTKQRIKRGLDEEVAVVRKVISKPKPAPTPKEKSVPTKSKPSKGPSEEFIAPEPNIETDPDKMTKADLELEIKRTELKKKLKEVSLLSIKEDKARGEVVPTELVNSLIREMSEAMKIAYMDGMENYTVVVARQKKMTTAEEAAIKSHFTGLINETLKRQTYVAKRGLKNVVKAYQEIRSKGESK